MIRDDLYDIFVDLPWKEARIDPKRWDPRYVYMVFKMAKREYSASIFENRDRTWRWMIEWQGDFSFQAEYQNSDTLEEAKHEIRKFIFTPYTEFINIDKLNEIIEGNTKIKKKKKKSIFNIFK